MKNWGWKNWTMFGVIVAIFIAAGVLVIVGVVTHTEPGFVSPENAWDQDTIDALAGLTVGCSNYAGGLEGCDVADDATETVNDRLGFSMFRYMGTFPDAEVQIVIGVPSEQGWMDPGGHTTLTGTGTTYEHCEVVTSNTGTAELLFLTLYHELGHCLGLAHDDYEQSIMRPTQTSTPDRTIPPWISDFDRGLLRDKYRRE